MIMTFTVVIALPLGKSKQVYCDLVEEIFFFFFFLFIIIYATLKTVSFRAVQVLAVWT